MDNLTILFGIFSRALQKKVNKSLKCLRGSFWTSGRINFFIMLHKLYYYTLHERRSGGYIGTTVCPSVYPSVCLSVRLSVQICVRPITFLWHRAKHEMPSASSHRTALKYIPQQQVSDCRCFHGNPCFLHCL